MNAAQIGCRPAGSRRAPERCQFPGLLLVVAVVVLACLLSDYDLTWPNPEYAMRDVHGAFRYGPAFTAFDLMRGFDCWTFDGVSRARFASYLVQLLNIKFRFRLFHYLTPHPTVSFIWPLTLLAAPALLASLVWNITASRRAACFAATLYLLSPGLLSTTCYVMHPGKALANVVIIAALWLSERMAARVGAGTVPSPVWYYGRLLALLIILWFGMFTDETAYFAVFACPLLFPALLGYRRRTGRHLIAFGLAFLAFLAVVTLLVPPLTAHYGFGQFDYWRLTLHGTDAAMPDRLGDLSDNFRFINVARQLHWLLASHLIPYVPRENYFGVSYEMLFQRYDRPPVSVRTRLLYLCYLALAAYAFAGLRPPQRRFCLRLIVTLLAFAVFHAAIRSRHHFLSTACFYYGAMFSPLFIMLQAPLLAARTLRHIGSAVVVLLLIIGVTNYVAVNRQWLERHFDRRLMPVTRGMVAEVWQERHDPVALARLQEKYPRRLDWLFAEIIYSGIMPAGEGDTRPHVRRFQLEVE